MADPTPTLTTLRTLVNAWNTDDLAVLDSPRLMDAMVEAFEALDEHLARGGELPDQWQEAQEEATRRAQPSVIGSAYVLNSPPSDTNRIPVRTYRDAGLFTEDYTYHRILSCRNHPHLRWSTKNPYTRSVFPFPTNMQTLADVDECTCPLDDATVIRDAHWPGPPATTH
jgi:hypothetical protein